MDKMYLKLICCNELMKNTFKFEDRDNNGLDWNLDENTKNTDDVKTVVLRKINKKK